VTGLDVILARLASHGGGHEPVATYANGVRHMVVPAPDGNSLSLAEAPSGGHGGDGAVAGGWVGAGNGGVNGPQLKT